jgi:hypothetical protein
LAKPDERGVAVEARCGAGSAFGAVREKRPALEAGFPHRCRVVGALCRGRFLYFPCGDGGLALFPVLYGGGGLVFCDLCHVGLGKLCVGAGGVLCVCPEYSCDVIAAASAGVGVVYRGYSF